MTVHCETYQLTPKITPLKLLPRYHTKIWWKHVSKKRRLPDSPIWDKLFIGRKYYHKKTPTKICKIMLVIR